MGFGRSRRRAVGLAAALVGFAVLGTACDDEGQGGRDGVWLAYATQFNPLSDAEPLQVVNLSNGERTTLNEDETTLVVSWSPDGSRLAALSVLWPEAEDENGAAAVGRVRIWSAPDWKEVALIPVEFPPDRLAWSPDGTRLALISGKGISVYDQDGDLLGSVPAPPQIDGGYSSGGVPRELEVWSPDSERVTALISDFLVIADREGKGDEYDPPPRADATERGGWLFLGWVSENELEMAYSSALGYERYIGVADTNGITWSPPEARPRDDLVGLDQEARREIEVAVPGSRFLARSTSADGKATVDTLIRETAANRLESFVTLIVRLDTQSSLVRLGHVAGRSSSFVKIMDMVVVGDPGDLPPVIVLGDVSAEPPPQQNTPALTPPAAITQERADDANRPFVCPSFPSESDGFTIVIPYPSPRNERVEPRVEGLPAFPGAREIDGFTIKQDGASQAVQMFETAATPEAVVRHYSEALVAQGYREGGGGCGVSGEHRDFRRGRDQVRVSTEYIPRPEDEQPQGTQPYGFRGKGRRLLEGNDGKTWFFVVTLRVD